MLAQFKNNKIIFLILFLCTFGTGNSFAKCSPTLNKDIQQIIDAGRFKYGIPGLQVSIGCPGEERPRNFVSGTTTIDDGATLVKPTNLFQIGSITKSFTAAILLKLEADGLLTIDDPIGNWLPQYPDWEKITIRQLLNHTSGIVNYTESDEFNRIAQDSKFKKQWTSDELIRFAVNKSYFEPGEGFRYSNTNYILAGMIISAVPGKSIEGEMKTLLSTALPHSNTHYLPGPYSEAIMKQMAHGYYLSEVDSSLIDATDYNMSMAGAAGALVSTSHDIAIWIRKLLTTTSVLPEQQRNEMMSLVDIENGQPIPITSEKDGYGLGVQHGGGISGSEVWLHSGATLGYQSMMIWLKCHDVVITSIINLNSRDGNIGLLTTDLISYIQTLGSSNQCIATAIPKKPISVVNMFKTPN